MKNLLRLSLVVALAMMAGCLPFPLDPDPVIFEVPDLDEPTNTSTYTGKAWLIGEITGVLADDFADAITFDTYDPTQSNAPIFIGADTVDSLTDDQLQGIVATFNAGHPIVLIHATADQIMQLYQVLAQTDLTFTMPDGFTTVEIYALDKEPEGDIVQWVQYPPTDPDDPDSAADQRTRVGNFVDWLKNNGERMLSAEVQASKVNALASGNDLTQLAAAFVDQSNFTWWGNNYQIVHYIYGCHSIDTNNDWFYVQQQCVFNGGGAYTGKKTWYMGAACDVEYYYMDTIELDSYMKGYDNNPAAVGMQQSSPQTANNTETVTSGVSFDIGGKVSIGSSGPSAEISGGVSISNSRTVTIKDCNAINKSNDRENNAHWLYQFKRCDTIAYFLYAGLTDPPSLAVNTFQPLNQWIWRMSPELRQNKTPMRVKLKVGLIATIGYVDFYWMAHPEHSPVGGGSWEYDVHIPYPGKP